MRIDKLEIQGFKSFADRTQIRFGQGVTGVVGPNGCGKSNIVDAIRWVMGEMSARTLRGGSMQDVIFNGSEKRGPMGMAEVTLTFENDGKLVPIEYQGFSQIQVTRRLYRDGESEYEINKTPCRLKDVHDLFLGTGVGSKAYSIIQQGQVAEIMRVKPEDRRRIIEEAAGITKYKARKEAAIRKMDATRQNLQRIDDVTKEIARRLGSLRRQAKKAEKYRDLKAQVREIELHTATFRFLELTNAINYDRDLIASMNEALSGDVDRVAQLETGIEEKRAALTTEERVLSETQARLYEIDNGLALNEQTAESCKREHERSLKRDEEAAVEVTRLTEQRAMLEGVLSELVRGKTQLELEFQTDESQLEKAAADLDAARAQRSGEASLVESLRRQVIERSTEAAKAASDVVNLKAALDDMTRRKEAIVAEQAPLADEVQRTRDAVATVDAEKVGLEAERSTKEQERSALMSSIQDKKRALDAHNRRLAEKTEELQKKRSRLHSLEEIHARYEQSPEAVRSLLKRGGPLEGRGRLFVDTFEAGPELELPLEAAFDKRLQGVVVPDEDAARAAVDFLADGGGSGSKDKKGRAELFVESAMLAAANDTLPDLDGNDGSARRLLDLVTKKPNGKGSPAVPALLGRVFLVDGRERAIALWPDAQQKNLTLVTKDGEVLEPNGVWRGGASAGADSGVLRQKREMRELAELTRALEADVAERQTQAAAMATELAGLDEDLSRTHERIQQLSLRVVEVKGLLRRSQEDLLRHEQRLSRLSGDLAKIDDNLGRAAGDLETRTAALHAAESERAQREAELQQRSHALIEMDQSIAAQQEAVTTMKVRAQSIAERKEMLSRNLEQSERQHQDVQDRLERLKRQIEEGHQERADLTTKEADARAQLTVLGEERITCKQRLDDTRAGYEKRSEEVRVLEHEARAARAALDAVRANHADLQVRIKERELELDAIVDRTIDHHRITPQEALFEYHMREMPPEDALDRMRELEETIDGLGAINLTAIDECKELEQRHEFLKTQADDLTHALNQLEKAIVKINRTTKKRFQETFDGVNERFQQVFPRLFRGGKAWLALTDPNDMLTTGVEIYAQPPGKKLGAITMMSGGEQALTAVSLIFSIFLLKPSPFCVLDEVDAPLDEANVSRFNDMVRDVANLSQFIVITHNKKTMEVADQLYGITMEEAGISKTVNVRIQ